MSKGKNKVKKENYNGNEEAEKREALEEKIEMEKWEQEQLEKDGKVMLGTNEKNHKIQLLSIIGEIEGHDVLGKGLMLYE